MENADGDVKASSQNNLTFFFIASKNYLSKVKQQFNKFWRHRLLRCKSVLNFVQKRFLKTRTAPD